MATEGILSTADDPWLVDIQQELSHAVEMLGALAPSVTLFGSARGTLADRHYQCAERLGKWLARAQVPVVTGGGPGIMEAANRGAQQASGISVGLNIQLPYDETPNPYLTHQLHFQHFATRKLMLTRYARGFAVFPGGFGTVDELMELLVAFHTDDASRRPMVLVDSDFWSGLLDWFHHELASRQLIDADRTDFIHVVDNERAALEVLLGEHEAADVLSQFGD